jgi:hypothetical protein
MFSFDFADNFILEWTGQVGNRGVGHGKDESWVLSAQS